MLLRIIFMFVITLLISACRGNIPRPDPTSDNNDNSFGRNGPNISENQGSTEQAGTGRGSYLAGDGPGSNAPANLDRIPDATPQSETLHKYANQPYKVLGKNYTPLTSTGTYKARGVASWYGKKFHGQKTSIGEIYDMYGMTAAHTTLPIPSYAKVTNLKNHKSVVVRVNDRGPFLHDRIIDLSYTAAAKIGIIGSGQGMVEVESLAADGSGPMPVPPLYKRSLQFKPLPPVKTSAAGSAYLQLGIFNSQTGAEEFHSSMKLKLNDTSKKLSISRANGMFRVRIGPYANADAARARALDLETRLGFKPMLSLN